MVMEHEDVCRYDHGDNAINRGERVLKVSTESTEIYIWVYERSCCAKGASRAVLRVSPRIQRVVAGMICHGMYVVCVPAYRLPSRPGEGVNA